MIQEAMPYEQPELEPRPPEPESKEKLPSAVIIGPDPLDEDNLPGSRPLSDDIFPEEPRLNS